MGRFSVCLLAFAAVVASCSETEIAGEYDNWQERNEVYVDSLANATVSGLTPDQAATGQLFRILAYNLNPDSTYLDNSKYVYCKKLTEGSGSYCPQFSDSVKVNYRGRLIPSDSYPEGYVFDQSFKTSQLDPEINVPTKFAVSGLVTGFSTALLYMHEGDTWRVWIPSYLGYGESEKTGIPEYSTLIFDINLTEIAKTGRSFN